jgi:hypothetical protein
MSGCRSRRCSALGSCAGWVTRGRPPRALPEAELVAVYRLWLVALLLTMVGRAGTSPGTSAGCATTWRPRTC